LAEVVYEGEPRMTHRCAYEREHGGSSECAFTAEDERGGRISKHLYYAQVEISVACAGCEVVETVILDSDKCEASAFESNRSTGFRHFTVQFLA